MNRMKAIMEVKAAKAFLFLTRPYTEHFEQFCEEQGYEVSSDQLDTVREWHVVSRELVEKTETYLELTRKRPGRRKDYEVFRIEVLERDITSLQERLSRLNG